MCGRSSRNRLAARASRREAGTERPTAPAVTYTPVVPKPTPTPLPRVTDIGARNSAGGFLIDAARTQAIFDARYVAKQEVPVHSQKDATSPVVSKKSCSSGLPVTVGSIKHNNSVRVLDDDGTWLTLDMDEDGGFDGYAPKRTFVANIKQTPDYHS
jgi:hypothetical protein